MSGVESILEISSFSLLMLNVDKDKAEMSIISGEEAPSGGPEASVKVLESSLTKSRSESEPVLTS